MKVIFVFVCFCLDDYTIYTHKVVILAKYLVATAA